MNAILRSTCPVAVALLALVATTRPASAELPASVRSVLEAHCYDCHQGPDGEGGLDLTALATDLSDPDAAANWVRVFDRVKDGEMPPEDGEPIEGEDRTAFLKTTEAWIRDDQLASYAELGRVRARRLTNLQLERTLQDLLGIDIPLAAQMPEEMRTDGFTTVAHGQAMSHFQLEQHVAVVDAALDEAFRRAFDGPDVWQRQLAAEDIVRRRNRRRTREPELINAHAVVWSGNVNFYGRIPATTAKEDGWYRFTIRAKALKPPADRGVWCTVQSGKCVSSAPLFTWVGAFEATAKPREMTFETWLPAGDMLEIRPGDVTLKRARFNGGQVGTGEGGPQNVPGVAIEWIKMEKFHRGDSFEGESVRQLLFGQLAVQPATKQSPTRVVSEQPREDAVTLMRRFAHRAFRRRLDDAVWQPYLDMTLAALDAGEPFEESLRAGYRALLCSPRFLYLYEQPGELDDFAIASRLSYLLWNTMPDGELLKLAMASKLRDPAVLREQVERMLKDPRGEAFVRDFAYEWLDLNLIDFTEPDRKLYPGFDLIVQQSMLAETHAYLQKMLRDDLSVGYLIDSKFTFLNERLARFYGIGGVKGDELQEVALKPADHRGGLMTQGAILKVTANGTATSPVIRGVWISERLLGVHVPPPPANVPAIEPDIRGAKTIREMLAKHKANASCASCHVKIDPPGFALESFDPSGRWRERYAVAGRGRRGPEVEPGYEMPDGRAFEDVSEFKSLVLADKEALARNVVEKLTAYGTGAPVQFADRREIDRIVSDAAKTDYGFRTLLYAVVTSRMFLNK